MASFDYGSLGFIAVIRVRFAGASIATSSCCLASVVAAFEGLY